MTAFIGTEQALAVINKLGLHVRDQGLLASALARPEASLFGKDAYESLELKAAALMSSLAQNRSLFDGNKRVSLILTLSFLGMNGFDATFTNDEFFDLVLKVAQGEIELEEITVEFAAHIRPRG